jgi:hypothetical protein
MREGTMENNEHGKLSPGQEVARALREAFAKMPPRRPRGPTPEFGAYLDTLDAMGIHIALYLLVDLKVPSSSLPTLLPMIDRSWFEDRLNFEINDILKKLEDDAERE